jgi:hypothetical protein
VSSRFTAAQRDKLEQALSRARFEIAYHGDGGDDEFDPVFLESLRDLSLELNEICRPEQLLWLATSEEGADLLVGYADSVADLRHAGQVVIVAEYARMLLDKLPEIMP